jgi:uncharacterized peroxidase-related enzyme
MTTHTIYTPESAPVPAGKILAGLEKGLGFVPNVFAVMAEAPPALAGFMALNTQFAMTSLTPEEREIVHIATSVQNDCRYCVAGHTAFAKKQGVSKTVIDAVRAGRKITDPKLAALLAFTHVVTAKRGHVNSGEIENFLAAGYTKRQLHEVLLGICVKTFSNLTSVLLQIPLDDEFAPYAWSPAEASTSSQSEELAA